jgi:dTDP-L-rhamnose 4-epimerase
VLAIFASRLLNGQKPMIFEDGEQRRDFVYVGDVPAPLPRRWSCRRRRARSSTSARATTVGDGSRAGACPGAWARTTSTRRSSASRASGDIRHCFCDTSKTAEKLGFTATRDFGEGLAELAEWVAGETADDRVDEARAELEARGLVA